MKHAWKISFAVALVLLVVYALKTDSCAEPAALVAAAQGRTVRLFVIGNSFSQNATQYLPQLAKEGGHQIVFGRAELGSHSVQQIWSYVEANESNPDDPKGKPYGGKSLRELVSAGTWDIITIQQFSLLSGDIETYRPYTQRLYDFLKKLQPQAEIVMHQTWAYRSDATDFGFINAAANQRAQTQKEMWEKSRAAYRAIADELGMRVLPVGDAFWKVSSDPQWAYQKAPNFDFENAVHPALPDQNYSLNTGYYWGGDKKSGFKLGLDPNHANEAGCYLGALVWYGFLFQESPEKLTFAPHKMAPDFAAHLRKVAWQIVQESTPASKANRLALQVSRTTSTPRVDAAADDPAWENAAVISSLGLSLGADAKLEAAPTSVRLLWDAKYLYLRFECVDEEPYAPFTGRDKPHYEGDVVEVFLDPVGDARQYVELQVTPRNQIFDQLFLLTAEARSDERGVLLPEVWARDCWTDLAWNMEDFKTATAILRNGNKIIGWRADLAIPAATLLRRLGKREFAPMTMRLNLLRYDWLKSPADAKEELTPNKTARQLVAMNWSPVQFGMPHMSPNAMGFVVLKDK